jgi:hypothetical protein
MKHVHLIVCLKGYGTICHVADVVTRIAVIFFTFAGSLISKGRNLSSLVTSSLAMMIFRLVVVIIIYFISHNRLITTL